MGISSLPCVTAFLLRRSLGPRNPPPFTRTLAHNARPRRYPASSPRATPPKPPPEPETPEEEAGKSEQVPGRFLLSWFLAISVPVLALNYAPYWGELRGREVLRQACEDIWPLGPEPELNTPSVLLADLQRRQANRFLELYYNSSMEDFVRSRAPMYEKYYEIGRFMRRHFGYSPANFSGADGEEWRPWTWISHEFSHSGVVHLVFCYCSLGVFIPYLYITCGAARVAGLFLAGGGISAGAHCMYENTYNQFAGEDKSRILKKLMDGELDQNEVAEAKRLYSVYLGSSSAILSLATLSAIIFPQIKAQFVFIPFAFRIRPLLLCQAALDLSGTIFNWNLGIAHEGHLFGNLSGLMMYYLWARRSPLPAMRFACRNVRWNHL